MDDPLDIHLEPSLDIDDAFSDTEPQTPVFQFSPDALRNDLARNSLSWRVSEEAEEEEEEERQRNGAFESTLNSISTLDIDSETESSSNFVSIPLSASNSSDLPESKESDEEELDEEKLDESEAPYPSVIIDVPSHKVTVSTDYTQTSAPLPSAVIQHHSDHSRSPSIASSDNSEHSTKSLPAPEPSSVTPTHPTFAASTSTSTSVLPSVASDSPTSPGLKPSQPIHRPTRSVGPSALEKVRSKTRPSFLPPKSRKEDDKHMADWEVMMRHSRAAGKAYILSLQKVVLYVCVQRKSGGKHCRSVG